MYVCIYIYVYVHCMMQCFVTHTFRSDLAAGFIARNRSRRFWSRAIPSQIYLLKGMIPPYSNFKNDADIKKKQCQHVCC